jgi:hypothetical protein
MANDQITLKDAPINWQCRVSFLSQRAMARRKQKVRLPIMPHSLCLFSYTFWYGKSWIGLQIVVAAILTLDMIGGVLTNSLGSMKRYLHACQNSDVNWLGRLVGSKFLFPAIHFQLVLVPLCFDIVGLMLSFGLA